MSRKKTKNNNSLRIINIFVYAFNGFWQTFKNELAFRQELFLLIGGSIFAFYFDFTHIERIVLIASLLFVLIIELLNSAIEAVVDRISLEYHELSKLAKDTASTAVAGSLVLAIFCWVMIVWEKFS